MYNFRGTKDFQVTKSTCTVLVLHALHSCNKLQNRTSYSEPPLPENDYDYTLASYMVTVGVLNFDNKIFEDFTDVYRALKFESKTSVLKVV